MNLREAEARSIRAFVELAAADGYLSGRVLDYGCGKQPYRDIVEAAGGQYVGYDHESFPAFIQGGVSVATNPIYDSVVDTVLCTQVLQYVRFYRDPRYTPPLSIQTMLASFYEHADHLVLTYPTNWPEVEPEDLHRFTKAGMELLLTETGFTIIRHDFRHGFQHEGVSFTCGYGVIARA